MLIWKRTYKPFIMGGFPYRIIKTEVTGYAPIDLGKGFLGIYIPGQGVFELSSGGLVGNTIKDVKTDIEACEDIASMVKQIKDAKTEGEKLGVHVSNEEFFQETPKPNTEEKEESMRLHAYDPNQTGIHTIRMTLQLYDHKGSALIKMQGNCKGMSVLSACAFGALGDEPFAFEQDCFWKYDPDTKMYQFALTGPHGDKLTGYRTEHEMNNMITSVEIIDLT